LAPHGQRIKDGGIVMLNIVDRKNEIDVVTIKTVSEILSLSDGFIVLSIKNKELQWNRYQLDNTETLYLLEWAKLRLMTDAGV
jgi:hypothetical protein